MFRIFAIQQKSPMIESSAPQDEQANNPSEHLRKLNAEIALEKILLDQLRAEVSNVVIGQSAMIDALIIALLTEGHVLLEGMPGLAKTLAIRSLSETMNLDFGRIQFTPDLLPADVTGTMIYQQKSDAFTVRKGPIFSSFLLADEINRAPAKVQSALLEAMQEGQVTIGENTFKLPEPFLVMATQNPIEQEGTYVLPEAQKDRFLMKIKVGYPSAIEEQAIIRSQIKPEPSKSLQKIISKKDILRLKTLVKQVYLDEKIEKYIVEIIHQTRSPKLKALEPLEPYLTFGASPRGGISLALVAKARAFMEGRAFVIPEDVKLMAVPVLNHRIGVSYEAEMDSISSDDIIEKIIQYVEVP